MNVSRAVLSISNLQQTIVILQKQKAELQQKLDNNTINLDARISHLQQWLELVSNPKQAWQKLCVDIEQAMNQYEKNYPEHTEQRSNSIFRIREWLAIMRANKCSDSNKHRLLAKCIIRELNAVEHDHNKSNFSKLFTESRLARAYMEVLRINCIDPYAAQYFENIELNPLARNNDPVLNMH